MHSETKIISLLLVTAAMALTGSGLHAQSADSVKVNRNFNIHYRVNEFDFDPAYLGNSHTLDRFVSFMDNIGPDNVYEVEIHSTSSPEGRYEYNKYLTGRRSEDMAKQVSSAVPSIKSKIARISTVESWDELGDLVSADTKMETSSVQRVLDVIGDQSMTPEARKEAMKNLGTDPNVGSIYQYLLKNYYPLIRNSYISVSFLRPLSVEPEPVAVPLPPAIRDTVIVRETVFVHDTVYVAPECPTVAVTDKIVKKPKAKETLFSLKTNLLYDAVTMINAEVEVPFLDRWSIMVEDVFPWWEFSKNKYALQNWEIGIEPRFWLRRWGYDKEKMLGHFFGVYGMSGRGDLQIVDKPNYQVHYWSAGLTYGYVLPLGRKHWGNLEFSISGGLLRSDYQHYQPTDDYDKLIKDPYDSGIINWWGPTKAKVSLVIPINFKTKRAAEYQASKK